MLEDEFAGHTPVLTKPVRELLSARAGETLVDATIGLGGHARQLAEALGADGWLIGLDVDPANLAVARTALTQAPCRIELAVGNFAQLPETLRAVGAERIYVLFADLGVSSTQLDDPNRGFSFQRDGPLDMRMDPRLTVTAAELVNRLDERRLGDVLYHNAQEFGARRIARTICERRRDSRITTTGRLAEVVSRALRVDPKSRRSKIHPATKTFLALRIAVNQEIENLNALLEAAPGMLRPGGRIGVIAFHSVEDKPVKLDFRRRKQDGIYRVLTKKPVVADVEERRANPRSRSAKLRVAVRLPEHASTDEMVA